MSSFDITLINYRCFAADRPVTLQMRPGLTGLVGPNNSGKSTLVRVFFELRNLLQQFGDPGFIQRIARGEPHGIGINGVGDPLEIFYNRNTLPVRIELRIPGASLTQVSGFDVTLPREAPTSWSGALRVGPEYRECRNNRNYPTFEFPPGSAQNLDPSLLVGLAKELSQSIYFPVTRTAIGQAHGTAYDLQFGKGFIALWDSWKTGPSRFQNDAVQAVTDDIARLFGFRRLEIAATPDKEDLHVAIDGKSFKLRELGAGLAQFIIVLGNIATRKPTWVFIDEPEISLHPALQLDFLTTLASYGASGALFATHSLGLARSADRMFSVQKKENKALVSPFETTGSLAEFLGEMSFASYRELGYDSVLLVEGINDVKPIQQWLRLLDKDHNVVLLHLGGSQMIRPGREAELSEVLRLSEHVYALIDSEKPATDAPLSANRREFLSQCARLNIRAMATQRRALENYFPDRAVKAAFSPSYKALGEFQARSEVNPIWAKADNWRIAREMTGEELLATDVGEFLRTL